MSLRTLNVYFDYPKEISADLAELAPALAGFFQRSCTRLSTLKLTKIPFSQNALIECLAFSPSLVSLDIGFDSRWDRIGKVILDRLNLNHPTHVLPRLRSLTFRGPINMFVEELVDTLVASRRHIDPKRDGVAMLENLTLESTFPQLVDEDGPLLFHRFVSEGLNIKYGKGWGHKLQGLD
ncbi:hypothetical protein BD779DRAFT_1685582 [Infundibulicybe gibba]|nr:hypothetical protein BD779DRAFT_1685582 [Infundibulicybe gibba]